MSSDGCALIAGDFTSSFDSHTVLCVIKDPHSSCACLCLKIEVFISLSPLGWAGGGMSVGLGFLSTTRPRPPIPPASLYISRMSLSLHLFANFHLTSFLFMTEPHNLSNVQCVKIKLMKWVTDEIFLLPKAPLSVGSGG